LASPAISWSAWLTVWAKGSEEVSTTGATRG
jgi:hypothetical protein